MLRGHDHRVPWMLARGNFGIDLVDQDHRIADHHADQRDDAEDRNESHRCARDKQRGGDTDESQRCGGKHKEQPLKALQLHHEDRDHDQDHEREDRENAGLRLGALLDRAACNHVITRRQFRFERGDIGGERFDNGRCLKARRRIGLHGDGWQTMAAPDQRRFDPVGELRDLLKRHRTPARHVDHQAAQGLQLGALVGNGAGDDVDQIDIIAQLRDGRAR